MNERQKKIYRAIVEAGFNVDGVQTKMEELKNLLSQNNDDKTISDAMLNLLSDIEDKVFDVMDKANEQYHKDSKSVVVSLDSYRARVRKVK